MRDEETLESQSADSVLACILDMGELLLTNGGESAVDVSSELDKYLAMMGWATKEE